MQPGCRIRKRIRTDRNVSKARVPGTMYRRFRTVTSDVRDLLEEKGCVTFRECALQAYGLQEAERKREQPEDRRIRTRSLSVNPRDRKQVPGSGEPPTPWNGIPS